MQESVHFNEKDIEVIQYLVRGKSMNEIAQLTFRSPRTIESRINNIKYKIGVNKKSDLIGWLIDHLYRLDLCA